MAAGDTCAADPVDNVYHEMDSTVHNHRFYKSVVASNRTTHPREGACRPIHAMNLQ